VIFISVTGYSHRNYAKNEESWNRNLDSGSPLRPIHTVVKTVEFCRVGRCELDVTHTQVDSVSRRVTEFSVDATVLNNTSPPINARHQWSTEIQTGWYCSDGVIFWRLYSGPEAYVGRRNVPLYSCKVHQCVCLELFEKYNWLVTGLSVRPSQGTLGLSKQLNKEQSELLALSYIELQENSGMVYLQKSLLSQSLDLEKFRPGTSTVANAINDGRQFVAPSFHVCVQHDGRTQRTGRLQPSLVCIGY